VPLSKQCAVCTHGMRACRGGAKCFRNRKTHAASSRRFTDRVMTSPREIRPPLDSPRTRCCPLTVAARRTRRTVRCESACIAMRVTRACRVGTRARVGAMHVILPSLSVFFSLFLIILLVGFRGPAHNREILDIRNGN
jgi:hypothetical protein